jgi:putative ABC transport system permease protein
MISLADSGIQTLFAGFEALGGSRMIMVWRKSPDAMESKQASYSRGLTKQDVVALKDIPHLQDLTEFVSMRNQGVQNDRGTQASADVVAIDGSFLQLFRYRAAQGRMIDEHDVINHARVCVLGHELIKKLFPTEGTILGRTISVLGSHCKVIGVLEKTDVWGMRFGWEWDNILALPLETGADIAKKMVDNGRSIFLLSESSEYNESIKRIMNARLMERHHGVDDFTLFDLKSRLEGFAQVFQIMKVIVGLLAGITILVGGVGIMNIMLVSVSERVREIGIRQALGAGPKDISRQFLVEAMLMSGIGGFIGIIMGICCALLGSFIIKHFKPSWITTLSYPAILAALLVAVLIGILFGYFPARKASRLDPVVAMRT